MTHRLMVNRSGQILSLVPASRFGEVDGFADGEGEVGVAAVDAEEFGVGADVPREDADFPDAAVVGPAGLCGADPQERDVAPAVEAAEAGPELGVGEHGQPYARFGFSTDYPFRYVQKRFASPLEGRRCRVVAVGSLKCVLVEFEGGLRHVVARAAIREVER